jgi:prophage regulatory protein
MDSKSKRYDATFPKQVKLSMASVGWVAVEVESWIESKIAQRG